MRGLFRSARKDWAAWTIPVLWALLLILPACSCSPQKHPSPGRLGVIIPLTGEAATYGVSCHNGIAVACEQVGLQAVFEDSAGDPKKALSAYHKLAALGELRAIIGDMFSAPTLAFAPLAQSRGIVVLSPTAGAEAVPKVGPLVFSLYPTARLEGQYMASYLAEHLSGEAPVVVVGAQEEVYQSIVQGFVDRLRQFGSLKIAMVESAPPETRNFRDIIAKFARPGPAPILYVAGSKTFVATLVAQAKQSGFNGRIFSQSTLYDPSLGRDFGEVLEGMTFTGPFYQPESMDEPIPEFVSRYKQHYGSVPDVWAAYGYDAVLAIATVLKDCSTCQGSSMAARLRSLSIKGTTGPIQFDQEGAASRAFRLFVFQQGVIKRAD